MWWHNISIPGTLEAQKAVGLDCLYAMPWGIVWAFPRRPYAYAGGRR